MVGPPPTGDGTPSDDIRMLCLRALRLRLRLSTASVLGQADYLDVGSDGPLPMLVRRDVETSEHAAWVGPDRKSRAPEGAEAN